MIPIDTYFSLFGEWYCTRTEFQIMSSFKYHSPNHFFLNFIYHDVLHDVQHKILTILIPLKTFSCVDLFSRPLCWSIYWWIMWLLCVFEYIAKNHNRVYITTVTGIHICSQGNVREKSGIFLLPTPWQPCLYMSASSRLVTGDTIMLIIP